MHLTIAIPTFNRNQILLENLKRLLPQLTQECKLLIIDNSSDVPVSETLKPVLGDFPYINIDIIRNKVNIGANANILRCFEVCETEWLWVLADDDTAKPDAIDTIFKHTALHPECLFFNFSSELYSREQVIMTKGVEDFIERVDNIWHVIFISSGIYRVDVVTRSLRLGYSYIYTNAPQLVMLLTSIGEEGVCCLSNERIVRWNYPPAAEQWSIVSVGLGIMTLLELPMKPRIRRILGLKIQDHFFAFRSFVYQLLFMAIKHQDYQSALYLYDQLCCRLYYFDPGWHGKISRKTEIFVCRLMLRFPQFGYKAIFAYKRLKGSKLDMQDHILQDRFTRL